MVPAILYKYRSLAGESFKFTQDIFLRKRAFLAPVDSLNDPCEGWCHLRPHPTAVPMGYEGWGAYIQQRDARSDLRVGSFTALNAQPLMWAHYADSHRGICIGFNTSAIPDLAVARPITYQTDLPPFRIGHDDLAQTAYLTKSKDWSYEQEWRVIRTKQSYITLSVDSIASVVIGARTSAADIEWVADWIRFYGGSVVMFTAAFSNDKYDMDISPR